MKSAAVSRPLARREFLRISSTAMIGIAASGLIKPSSLFAATRAEGSSFQPLLSIGYAPTIPWTGTEAALRSADGLLMSDPLLITRDARVSVIGSGRAPNQKNAPGSLYLDAVYPATSGAASESSRFGFWSVAGHSVRDSFSNRVSFTVPALATTGLSFIARYRHPELVASAASSEPPALEPDSTPFTLSFGAAPGPKLQCGVWVIALREATDSATPPNWEGLRIANHGGTVVVPDANFSYVVLSVEYGDGHAPKRSGRRRIA